MKLKRPLMVLLGAGAIVSLGLGIAAFFKFYDFPFLANQAPEAAAAYRAAGLPWEQSDIQPTPPVADKDNAAPALKKAISKFLGTAFDSRRATLKKLTVEGEYAQIETLLTPYASSFAAARRAVQKPRFALDRDWDIGFAGSFPELKAIKYLVEAMLAGALSKAGLGDASAALADLEAAWRLGQHLSQLPDLHSSITRLSLESHAFATMEACAQLWKNDPATLTKLGNLLKNPGKPIDWPYVFRGEMYQRLATLRNIDPGPGFIPHEATIQEPIKRTGFPESTTGRGYAARFLSVNAKIGPILENKENDIRAIVRQTNKVYESLEPKSLSASLDGILFPTFENLWKVAYKCEAHRICLQILVEGLLIQGRTGRFPEDINDVPGTWLDPFTKTPIRIKRTGGVVRIYSVGPNQEDNGGIKKTEGNILSHPGERDDVVVTHPPLNPAR